MNEQTIYCGKMTYFVKYHESDECNVITKIIGTLDTDSHDDFFDLPTSTLCAQEQALQMLRLNSDYWRFA